MSRFLTLTNAGVQPVENAGNQTGLYPLRLDCWEKSGAGYIHVGRLIVNSGQPWAQEFTDLAHERPGRYEPIPEGRYQPGPLEFASGRWEDYSGEFREIQSPIWMVIHRTRAIGFHLDGNREFSPGSAGCPVFRSMSDLKIFVGWHRGNANEMTSLWVDWSGVGGTNLPPGLKIPA